MRLLILLLMLFGVACSGTPGAAIYRTSVQQGNIVTPKMVGQLEIGMTKAQAAFILGQPVLRTFYKTDRWDYVYRLQSPLKPVVARKLTLYFAEGKLTSFVTDIVTEQVDAAASDEPTEANNGDENTGNASSRVE